MPGLIAIRHKSIRANLGVERCRSRFQGSLWNLDFVGMAVATVDASLADSGPGDYLDELRHLFMEIDLGNRRLV